MGEQCVIVAAANQEKEEQDVTTPTTSKLPWGPTPGAEAYNNQQTCTVLCNMTTLLKLEKAISVNVYKLV